MRKYNTYLSDLALSKAYSRTKDIFAKQISVKVYNVDQTDSVLTFTGKCNENNFLPENFINSASYNFTNYYENMK